MADRAIIGTSPLVGVDTNFLIDLYDGHEHSLGAWEVLHARTVAPRIVVLPTVVQEIAYLAKTADSEEERERYRAVAATARSRFFIEPINFIPVGHGIIERCAEELRSDPDLIPAVEVNDSFIVAEACLAKCSILITSDQHICGMDKAKAKKILEGYGSNPLIVWPKLVLKVFK